MNTEAPGTVHWSIEPLIGNNLLQQALQSSVYAREAHTPPMNWIQNRSPDKPEVHFSPGTNNLEISLPQDQNLIKHWTIYSKYGDSWQVSKVNKFSSQVNIPFYKTDTNLFRNSSFTFQKVHILEEVYITYQDRFGVESNAVNYTF